METTINSLTRQRSIHAQGKAKAMTTSTIERHAFISFALTRWKRLDIKRAYGTHRTVFLLGSYAFKFPVVVEWRLFLCGLLANMQEVTFSRTGWPELCPVVFALPGGFLNVMRRAEPLTREEFFALDFKAFVEKPDYHVPVEDKLDSFGKLNGEIVAVDYGS